MLGVPAGGELAFFHEECAVGQQGGDERTVLRVAGDRHLRNAGVLGVPAGGELAFFHEEVPSVSKAAMSGPFFGSLATAT